MSRSQSPALPPMTGTPRVIAADHPPRAARDDPAPSGHVRPGGRALLPPAAPHRLARRWKPGPPRAQQSAAPRPPLWPASVRSPRESPRLGPLAVRARGWGMGGGRSLGQGRRVDGGYMYQRQRPRECGGRGRGGGGGGGRLGLGGPRPWSLRRGRPPRITCRR